MTTKRWEKRVALLACGAIPLITTASCDPYYGTLDFFRDDDAGYFYDDYGYDEVIIFDDCLGFFDCF